MMRSKLLFVLACLLSVGLNVFAADLPITITEIAIDGNKKIETADIMKVVPFNVGDEITSKMLKAASQAIYDLGWFSDVIPEVSDDAVLTFSVTENPVVKEIEITGNANTEEFNLFGLTLFRAPIMSSDKARRILRDKGVKKDKVLNNNSLNDGLKAIIDAYEDKGYVLVSIGSVTPGETLRIQIVEGKVTGNIVTGLSSVPESVAEDMIELPLGECLKSAPIQQVVSRLQASVYFSNVDVKAQQGATADSVRLLWSLTERVLIDDPISISGLNIAGVTVFPWEITAATVGEVALDEIDNYELLSLLKGLFDLYYRNGYVMVEFEVGPVENGKLTVVVKEGEIGEVNIAGNEKTKTYVISKVFGLKPGDVFNRNRLAVYYQELMSLGYFNSVNVDPQWVDGKVDVSVSVVESKKLGGINGSIAFSPPSGGLVGKLDYSQKNLFGTGQDLSFSFARGLINDESATWNLGYSTVAFFRGFERVGLDLYRQTDEREVNDDSPTTYLTIGASGSVSYPVVDFTTLNLSFKHEEVTSSKDQITYPVNSVTTGISYDDVRNPFFPTSGNRRSISLEKAGGFAPGPSYTKVNISWIKFSQLYSNLPFVSERDQVFAVRLAAGWGSNIPASEAYSLGGAATIRGTTVSSVSRLVYSNFEYRLAIVEGLTGVLFLDAGASLDQVTLSSAKGSFGIELGIEAAGIYVRLDAAWVLGKDMSWVPTFDFGFSPMF
jgi:outer membrane protein insertion porin family